MVTQSTHLLKDCYPHWYRTHAIPKFGLQRNWITGACHYTRLYLDIGGHGDGSTRLFGGHRGFYDGQWPLTGHYFKHWYHFPSTLVLLEYQNPFTVCYFWILLISQLSCLDSEFQHYSTDCEFQHHAPFKQGLQVCSYCLEIGQDQLKVALTM